MEVEIENNNIEFKSNPFINTEMSYAGIYEKLSKLIWTNIHRSSSNKIDIFPITIEKDWVWTWFTNNYISKNPVFTNQEVNGWLAYIKEKFYEFKPVESIYYAIADEKFDIWLIIQKRDFKLIRRLVDLEMSVVDIFETNEKSLCQYEFHIIYRGRHKETDLIPQQALRLPK